MLGNVIHYLLIACLLEFHSLLLIFLTEGILIATVLHAVLDRLTQLCERLLCLFQHQIHRMVLLIEIATRDIVTGENITYELCLLTWHCYDASHLVLCVAEGTWSSEDDRHWLVQSCSISEFILLYQDGIVLHTSVLKDYHGVTKVLQVGLQCESATLCHRCSCRKQKSCTQNQILFHFVVILLFTNFYLIHVAIRLHIRLCPRYLPRQALPCVLRMCRIYRNGFRRPCSSSRSQHSRFPTSCRYVQYLPW